MPACSGCRSRWRDATSDTLQVVPMVVPPRRAISSGVAVMAVRRRDAGAGPASRSASLLRQHFQRGDVAQAALGGLLYRGLLVFGGGFQPVHAGFRPGHLDLTLGVAGQLQFVLRIAVAGGATHDLELQASGRLAIDQHAEGGFLTGEQVVRVADGNQLDAAVGWLQCGVIRRTVGDEGFHAADRLAHFQLLRVLRQFAEGGHAAAPALALAVLLVGGEQAVIDRGDAIGARLLQFEVEHAAVLAGGRILRLHGAAIRGGRWRPHRRR
ncbi:hypothetical protein G6F31_015951 [Rhizopus arrhizus]|nr:hypothetical protein G6F31_015951 [Rhizopus arrhizus]